MPAPNTLPPGGGRPGPDGPGPAPDGPAPDGAPPMSRARARALRRAYGGRRRGSWLGGAVKAVLEGLVPVVALVLVLALLAVPGAAQARAAAGAAAAAPAASPRPTAAVDISDGGFRTSEPALAVSGTTLFAAYADGAVSVRTVEDSGTRLQGSRRLGAGTVPDVDAAGDVAAVAFAGPSEQVLLGLSTDRGRSWTVTDVGAAVGRPDLTSYMPKVAVGSRAVYVAFGDTAGGWGHQAPVRVATLTLGGAWSLAELGTSDWQGRALDVAASGPVALVAFDDGDAFVRIRRTDDAGTTWTTPAAIPHAGSGETLDVAVRADGMQAWVATGSYRPGSGSAGDVRMSLSTDAGATFAAPVVVNDAAGALVMAGFGMAVDSGSAYLSYTVPGRVEEAQVYPDGQVTRRTAASQQGTGHAVAASDEMVAVAWTGWAGAEAGSDVFVASRRVGSSAYLTRDVGDSTGLAHEPALAAFGGSWAAAFTDVERPAGGGLGTSGVYLATGSPLDPDLRVEAASAVQAAAGPTALAAGKLTALRARLRVTLPQTYGVGLRWRAEWTDETGARRTYDAREFRTVPPGLTTLHHELPAGWRPGAGAIAVSVTVDPDDAYPEPDETNNTAGWTGQAVATKGYKVLVKPLSAPGTPAVACAVVDRAAAGITRGVAAAFPVDDRQVTVDRVCSGPELDVDAGTTMTDVDFFGRLRFVEWPDFGYDNVVYVVPDGFFGTWLSNQSNALGLAWSGRAQVVLEASVAAGYPALHELSHSRGWVDPASPIADAAHPAHTANLPAPGYFVAEHTTLDTVDYMHWQVDATPGTLSRWISQQTWNHLLGTFRADAGIRARAAGDLLEVAGSVGADGAVRAAVRPAPAGAAATPAGAGSLRVVLRGAGGAELAAATAEPAGSPDAAAAPAGTGAFSVVLPDAAGATSVQVVRGQTVLATLARSAAAPTVALTAPTGGTAAVGSTLPVRWTAADADGGTPTGFVAVSTDGTAWRTVGRGTGAFDLPLTAALAGTLRVRVTVTDGWSAAADQATVTVGGGVGDGRIYTPAIDNPVSPGSVFSAEADGSSPTRVVGAGYEAYDAQVSPDGTTVAFVSTFLSAHPGLFVVPAAGGTPRMLLRFGDRAAELSEAQSFGWSPDGRRLVVATNGSNGNPAGLYLVEVADGSYRRLADLNIGLRSTAAWAPDGSRIAFVDDAGPSDDTDDVFTVAPDGTDRRAVISTPSSVSREYTVAWSPDSRQLVVERDVWADRDHRIWTVDADGRNLRPVPVTGYLLRPVWSPTGDRLLVARPDGGIGYALATFPVVGGPVVPVAGLRIPVAVGYSWAAAGSAPPSDPGAQPLAVDAGGPYAADEGGRVSLRAAVTGGDAAVVWDTDGDGVFDDAEGAAPTVDAPAPGDATVAVRATAADGRTATDTAVVAVRNLPPVVSGAAGERSGDLATVTAAVTGAVRVTVDLGAGAGPQPAALAGDRLVVSGPAGTGPAVVVATDAQGASTRVEVALPEAPNAAPTATAAHLAATSGAVATAAGIAADADGDLLALEVVDPPAHGSVAVPGQGAGPDPAVAYRSEPGYVGEDSFTVVASDGRARSAPATVTVTVRPGAGEQAAVSAGPDAAGAEGSPLPLAGSATGLAGAVLRWTLAPAGADPGTACTVAAPAAAATTATCTDDATVTARLEAVRDGHVVASDTAVLTVGNAAPAVALTSPADGAVVDPGQPVLLAASADDPGANDAVRTVLDPGDGSAPVRGRAVRHVYARPGVYQVQATATDDDGGVGTAAGVVVVRDPAVARGFAAGAGRVDGARVGFAVYAGRSVRGTLVVCRAQRFVARVDALAVSGRTARFSGPALVDGRPGYRAEATVVDGSPDTVQLRVTTAAGKVVWSSGGPRVLHPGGLVVRAG